MASADLEGEKNTFDGSELEDSSSITTTHQRLIDYFVIVGYDGIPEHSFNHSEEFYKSEYNSQHSPKNESQETAGPDNVQASDDTGKSCPPPNLLDSSVKPSAKTKEERSAVNDSKKIRADQTASSFNCDHQANCNNLYTGSSPDTYHHRTICPRLIRRYPSTDYPDFPLPPDVVYFAQPEGCFVSYQYYHDPLRHPSRGPATFKKKPSHKNRDKIANAEFSNSSSESDTSLSSSNPQTPKGDDGRPAAGGKFGGHRNGGGGPAAPNWSGRDHTTFVFTLTDKDSGKTRFGICLNYFSPIKDDPPTTSPDVNSTTTQFFRNLTLATIAGTEPESEQLKSHIANSQNYTNPLNIEDVEEDGDYCTTRSSRTAKIPVYLTSLCLISHFPFFTRFRDLLNCLKKLIDAAKTFCNDNFKRPNFDAADVIWKILTRDSCESRGVEPMMLQIANAIESWLERLLQAPVPIPGKTKIELTILPKHFSPQILIFALPDTTRFSLIDFPLHLPLELLGIDVCLKVLTCIILEQKVLIQSRDHNALTMSVLALVAMIYPLEYMFPIIPLLPVTLKGSEQLLLAPTPYFIGVPATFLFAKRVSLPRDVWLVDLDTNQLINPPGLDVPILPEPEGTILRNHLKQALYDMSAATPLADPPVYFELTPTLNLPPLADERGKEDSFSLPVTPLGALQNPPPTSRTLSSSPTHRRDTLRMGPLKGHGGLFVNDVDLVDMTTRVAMVKFFDSPNMFAHFEDHCHILRLYPRPVIAFQIDSFLKSRPRPTRFVYELAKTQAFEFFAEWSLSPNNAAFQRVKIGVTDPRLIGDKPKWYVHSLVSINFNALSSAADSSVKRSTQTGIVKDCVKRKDSLAHTPDQVFYVILNHAYSHLLVPHAFSSKVDGAGGKEHNKDVSPPDKWVDILKGVLTSHHHPHLHPQPSPQFADSYGPGIEERRRLPPSIKRTFDKNSSESSSSPYSSQETRFRAKAKKGSKFGKNTKSKVKKELSRRDKLVPDDNNNYLDIKKIKDTDESSFISSQDEDILDTRNLNGGGDSSTPFPESPTSREGTVTNKNYKPATLAVPNVIFRKSRISEIHSAGDEVTPYYEDSTGGMVTPPSEDPGCYTSSISLPTMSPVDNSSDRSPSVKPHGIVRNAHSGTSRKGKTKYSLSILNTRNERIIPSSKPVATAYHETLTNTTMAKPTNNNNKRAEKLHDILQHPRFPNTKGEGTTELLTKHLATTLNTLTHPQKLFDVYAKTFWFKTRQEVGLDEILPFTNSKANTFESDLVKRPKRMPSSDGRYEATSFIDDSTKQISKTASKTNTQGTIKRTSRPQSIKEHSYAVETYVKDNSSRRQPVKKSFSTVQDHNSSALNERYNRNEIYDTGASIDSSEKVPSNNRRRRYRYTSGDNLKMSDTESTAEQDKQHPTYGFSTESNTEISARVFLNEIAESVYRGQGIGWLKLPKLKTLLKHESCRLYLINKLNPNANLARNNYNSERSSTTSGSQNKISTYGSNASLQHMANEVGGDDGMRNLFEDLKESSSKKGTEKLAVTTKNNAFDWNYPDNDKLDSIALTNTEDEERYAEFEKIYQTSRIHFIPDVCLNKSVWKGYQNIARCCLSGLEDTYANYGIGGMASSYALLEICGTHYYYNPIASSASSASFTLETSSLPPLSAPPRDSRFNAPPSNYYLKRRSSLLDRQLTLEDIKSTCTNIIDPEKTYKKLSYLGKRVSTTLSQAASNVLENLGSNESSDMPTSYKNASNIEDHISTLPSTDKMFGSDHIPTYDEYLIQCQGQQQQQQGEKDVSPPPPPPTSISNSVGRTISRNDSNLQRQNMLPSQRSIIQRFYTKEYLYTTLIGKNRSRIWDENQFWQDIFLDAVTQERDMIGMDIGPSEMIHRFVHLTDTEKKRLELEEDHLLAIQLLNLVSFMVMMKANHRETCRKVRRLLAKAHMGLQYSQTINKLLDHINEYEGNRVPLMIPLSRRIRKMSFTVKSGVDPSTGTMVMEVCEDAIVFRTIKGDIIDRLWYEKLINMTLSPRARVVCLWWKSGMKTYLQKFYTKKCRELYEAIKDIMEKIAAQQQRKTMGSEIGGHFEIGSLYSSEKGEIDISLDGITISFPDGKTTLHLDQIKRCRSEKDNNIFILQIFDYFTQELVDLMYTANEADKISLAFHRVLSVQPGLYVT